MKSRTLAALAALFLIATTALFLTHPQLKKKLAWCLQKTPLSSRIFGPVKGWISAEQMSRQKGCSIQYVTPRTEHNFEPYLPRMKTHSIYDPCYVLRIEHGRVYSEKGVVIGPEDQVLWDTLREFGQPLGHHPIFEKTYMPRVQHLKGSWALLATPGQYVYYHWIFEILPRLELLRASGVTYDGLLTPNLRYPFMKETLQELGVDLNHCKTLDFRCHLDV